MRDQSRPKPRRPGAFVTLMSVAAVGVLTATAVLLLAAPWARLADLLTFATPWIAAGALLVTIVAAVMRAPGTALAAAVVTGIAAVGVAGALGPSSRDIDAPSLRVTTFNILQGMADGDAFLAWVETERPDVIILQEYEFDRWRTVADRLSEQYPYRSATTPQEERFTFVQVFSRYPLDAREAVPIDARFSGFGLLRMELTFVSTPVVLYAVHLPTPRFSDADWDARNDALADLAARVRAEPAGRAVIVAGDFNVAPWSPFFGRLLDVSGLADTGATLLRPPTRVFRRAYDLVGAPVDHILVSAGLGWRPQMVGETFGSDHRMVTTDVLVPG